MGPAALHTGQSIPFNAEFVAIIRQDFAMLGPVAILSNDALRWKITQLMTLRKLMGIHAGSAVDIKAAGKNLYAAIVDGRLAVKLGSASWSPGWGWQPAVDGDRIAVWIRG